MTWLQQPVAIIKAYARMLPRLEGEEALEAVARTAAGTGSMQKKDLTRVMNGWSRQAAGPSAATRKPRFNLAALSAAGVAVQKIGEAQ